MIRRRVKWLAIVATAVAVGVTGTGSGLAAAKVTMTFWHTYNPEETRVFMEEVLPKFHAQHPEIQVNAVAQPYDGLHDSLIVGVAGGVTPDVMRMDIIWVPEFAKLGALEPLDAYPGFAALKDQVFPGPLATNYYRGMYYGIPLNTNTQVFIYNPDFLKEAGLSVPPTTIDEFKRYAAAFRGRKDKYAFAPGGPYPWQMLPWFWSLGGRITDDAYTKASGYLNGEASVRALEEMNGFVKDGTWAPTLLGAQPTTWDGYKEGRYGALLEGPWFFALMKDVKAVSGLVPAGPAGSISVVGGENIVIFRNSKNKQAAWEFVRFMLSDEAQTTMARAGVIPVTVSASRSDAVRQVAYYEPYVRQLATARPRTPVPVWNRMDKILNDAFESVFRGVATSKEALDRAAREVDASLAR